MADHLEEYFLHKTQLAAAEKGWEESLIREKELRRYLAAILIQCGGQQTICWEFIEQVRGDYELRFNDVSTPFERAVKAEFVRTTEAKGAE